ncbi:DUF6265 family protein [Brevundimonas viscosa]|uniref:DUF6265 domain-containing protein n=1 Tax=Brevundimonas viscosa TaxID=871741 RepID=A0A1I6PAH9_9CAUL|nr:DUF6265 family protein [Brevundimonas viscosa]SFS37163.1 hypothetical protein SAMN05192570_0980 [Brevundimonas viscosa]
MSLAAFLLAAAAQAPTPDALAWMSGYWLSCEDGREVSETWSDPRGGLLAGRGKTFQSGEATFELSHIGPRQDGLAYFARPNGRAATVFAATEIGDNRAVFENPAHDFPTRIVYEREGEILSARIEGEMEGRPVSMGWRFRSAELNSRCPD